MKATAIFKRDMKSYSVSRLDSLTIDEEGVQQQNRTPKSIDLAIYDKGTKQVKKLNEDSYLISTIHIYSEPKKLNLVDIVTFNDLAYEVLESKNFKDHSFYEAVANV